MNGYRTSVFEMHTMPGGLCAAWKRKGYTFDISMHMVANSRYGPFHRMWEELGVAPGCSFHYHRDLMRVESGGKQLTVGLDRRELEQAMLALSPSDAKMTREFCRLFYGRSMMGAATLKPAEHSGFGDTIRLIAALLPFAGTILKYSKSTIQDFAARFRDPFLRNAVRFIIDSPGWPMPRFPLASIAGFADAGVANAGVPLGGSHQVVRGIADRVEQLGGNIHYRSRVTDIIVENDRAVGVRLEDGAEHRADTVIWAADGHHLIYDMLGGRYLNDAIRQVYDTWMPVFPLVHVMIGVNRDLSDEPHRMLVEIDEPIRIADEDHRWLCVIHHCFDPSMAPSGRSAVEVWYATRYDYWEALARDRKPYDAEKERIARRTIAELDKRWPGFSSQVEVVDVPTPATYVRYTGNWRGSPDGWYVTPENMMGSSRLRMLPGLSNLYMAGQWTAPFTGTVIAALTGRQVVEIMCKRDRRRFVTQT